MLQVDNTIVSFDIFEKKFVCDLEKCKGACCIHGDSGAPLEEDEKLILRKIYKKIKPYLREEGVKSVKDLGVFIKDADGDYVTPLVNGKECAYVIFENGIAKCAIEKAYLDGKIEFKKPISCHLYPIRITKYKKFDAVNYHEWDICRDALKNGKSLDVNIFTFLKESLIRKYGQDWYEQLKYAEKNYEQL